MSQLLCVPRYHRLMSQWDTNKQWGQAQMREAVVRLSTGKPAGVYKITSKLIKAEDAAMIHRLHGALVALWQFDTISNDWERGWLFLSRKRKGTIETVTTEVNHFSVCKARCLLIYFSCEFPTKCWICRGLSCPSSHHWLKQYTLFRCVARTSRS